MVLGEAILLLCFRQPADRRLTAHSSSFSSSRHLRLTLTLELGCGLALALAPVEFQFPVSLGPQPHLQLGSSCRGACGPWDGRRISKSCAN